MRFAAAKALWTLKDPEGENALLSVLSGDVKASSSFFNKQKRDALRLLQTPRPLMMVAIRAGAGFAPVPGLGMGISSLQGILNDPTISGRAATALLLADDKDPRVLAALIDALQDKEGSVRAAACHAIALRNDRVESAAILIGSYRSIRFSVPSFSPIPGSPLASAIPRYKAKNSSVVRRIFSWLNSPSGRPA